MNESMYLRYFTSDVSFPFFIQYGGHDTDMWQHYHADFSELVFVLKGSALHRVDGETYPVTKGDVFVINGSVSHGYSQTESLRICNVMFQQRFIGETAADLGRLAGYQALFQVEPFLAREYSFKSRLHLSVAEQDDAENLIQKLVAEYQRAVAENEAGCRTMVRSRFLEMVVMLSRWYQRLAPAESGNPINLAKAVAFIENHYSQNLTLGEIAEQAGLSPRHFSRLFNENYGMSPMRYLQRTRLRKACSLLEDTEDSVINVSLECGFQDSNNFSRQFRQCLGTSPSDWRKRRKV